MLSVIEHREFIIADLRRVREMRRAGGIDLIGIYRSYRYGMAQHGSLTAQLQRRKQISR